MRKTIGFTLSVIISITAGILLYLLKAPEVIGILVTSFIAAFGVLFSFSKNEKTVLNSGNHRINNSKSESLGMSLNLANASKDMFLETNMLYETSQKVYKATGNVMELVKEDDSNIEAINERILKIAKEIELINQDAVKTQDISKVNIDAVNIGKVKISDVSTNMEALTGANDNFLRIVGRLQESSQSIHKIVEYINEISNKTNMLSLNASIEAARAGESGKGFMVITKEIKKLADQSRSFSENIKKFVQEIEENVASIESVAKLSNEKIGLTDKAIIDVKRTLDEIDNKSSILDESVNMILNSSTNIRSSSEFTAEKVKTLILSHSNTLDLMKENVNDVTKQWNIVENFKKITAAVSDLSDSFLTQCLDPRLEEKLVNIGREIMNYAGDRSQEGLLKFCNKLGVESIFYANNQGVFEIGTIKEALGLNIFEIDKRFLEFVKSGEDARPYPLSRNFDSGELYKFMAVKRLDAEGVISVGMSIGDLLKIQESLLVENKQVKNSNADEVNTIIEKENVKVSA